MILIGCGILIEAEFIKENAVGRVSGFLSNNFYSISSLIKGLTDSGSGLGLDSVINFFILNSIFSGKG